LLSLSIHVFEGISRSVSTAMRRGTSGGKALAETNPLQTQFMTGVALSERRSWAGENL
jgi:hypothetical protein